MARHLYQLLCIIFFHCFYFVFVFSLGSLLLSEYCFMLLIWVWLCGDYLRDILIVIISVEAPVEFLSGFLLFNTLLVFTNFCTIFFAYCAFKEQNRENHLFVFGWMLYWIGPWYCFETFEFIYVLAVVSISVQTLISLWRGSAFISQIFMPWIDLWHIIYFLMIVLLLRCLRVIHLAFMSFMNKQCNICYRACQCLRKISIWFSFCRQVSCCYSATSHYMVNFGPCLFMDFFLRILFLSF